MKSIIAVLALALSQDPAPLPVVQESPQVWSPIELTLKAAPGTYRLVSTDIQPNGVIEVGFQLTEQKPTKRWHPTAYISLDSDQSPIKYFLNIGSDGELEKQYVRAKVVDTDSATELASHLYENLVEPSSITMLKIVVVGKSVTSYVNDVLIETRDLPYEPQRYDLGVSSGSYKMTVIEEVRPPAPD